MPVQLIYFSSSAVLVAWKLRAARKPAVWKDARRFFYWAVRARVARSAALRELADASPGATYEYRARLLDTLASLEPTTPYRQMAENLEDLDLAPTVIQLRADHLLRAPNGACQRRSQSNDEQHHASS